MPSLSTTVGEPGVTDGDDQERWLLCCAGSCLFALPLGDVIEIMRVVPVQQVARAPIWVRGLAIVRGTPTPVIDTSLLCTGHAAPSHRLVTVRAGTRMIAMAVGAVLGVRSIKAAESLPPLLREATSEVVSTIGRLDAELLLFLNTARIVPGELLERPGDEGAP
jgi:purine-binding chemotaxis protein CheW